MMSKSCDVPFSPFYTHLAHLYYVAMVSYISSVCGRLVGANFLSILLNPGPTVALLCSCEVYNEPELRYLGFQRARVL